MTATSKIQYPVPRFLPPLLFVCALLFVNDHKTSGADQYGVFQAGARRTGMLHEAALPKTPVVLWTFRPEPRAVQIGAKIETSSPGLGACIASDGLVFATDESGKAFALDAATGKLRWQNRIGGQGGQQPTVVDETVYLATGFGVITLAGNDGQRLWTHNISQGAAESSPLIVDGTVFVAGYDGNLHALDTATGRPRWSCDLLQDAPSDPPGFDGNRARLGNKPARPMICASDGEHVFQPIFDQCRLVAVDCRTGKLQWSFQSGGWMRSNPVITDRFVLIGSQDDKFYCLNKSDGQIVWTFATKSRIEAGAAVDRDGVFFGACDGTFVRLALDSGKTVWSFDCEKLPGATSAIYSAPLVSGGVVYFAAMEGQVYALDAANGRLLWKIRASDESEIEGDLATDGRRIFVTTRKTLKNGGENSLVAIGSAKEGSTP